VLEMPDLGVSVEFRRTTAGMSGELVEFDLVGRRRDPSRFRTSIQTRPSGTR
jgi:hypothetical protein